MTPLAHCWPSIYLSRCHKIGIPVLTHSSLRYLHPHIQHSTPHQHFLSWFTHPELSRNRSLAYPRATVTPGAQHRTVTRLPQSQSHFPSAQSPCHTPVPTPPLIAVPLVQISLCSDYFSRENLSLGFCQRSVGICEADSAQILEGSGEWPWTKRFHPLRT